MKQTEPMTLLDRLMLYVLPFAVPILGGIIAAVGTAIGITMYYNG